MPWAIGGPAASGQASATPTGSATKPTIVIVHGGWADSSGWGGEISRLTKAGYPVIAPANPLRGLTSDSDYIRSVLQSITGPIVLVGHSYGGAVISNAARGVPNVKALVFIAAFAPDTGETLAGLVTMNPGTMITPDALDTRPYPLPGGGEGTDLYIKQSAFHDAFAGDLPVATTNLMWARAAAILPRCLHRALGRPGLEDDSVVVPRLNQGSRDPARHRMVHGPPRARAHRNGQRIARVLHLAPRGDDRPHPQGRTVGFVTVLPTTAARGSGRRWCRR